MIDKRVISQVEKIFDAQKMITPILSSEIYKQTQIISNAYNNIVEPYELKLLREQAESLRQLIPHCNLLANETLENLNNIRDVLPDYIRQLNIINNNLKNTDIFSSINVLRETIPACFIYEHGNSGFYDKEIYPYFFNNGAWNIEINKDSSVSFNNKNIQIAGDNIREVAAVQQLFPEISEEELIQFISYLKKFPLFALSDPNKIGKKIFDALKNKILNYTVVLAPDTNLYRARELEEENEVYYTEEAILEPNTGIPSIGRFNPYGVSLLYVAEDSETAKKELSKKKYQIAKLRINSPLTVLDLEKHGGLLYKYCNQSLVSTDYNPPEYILANFIGQCGIYLKNYCNIPIDGFKYRSTECSNKYCYVLFEVHNPDIQVVEICHERSIKE